MLLSLIAQLEGNREKIEELVTTISSMPQHQGAPDANGARHDEQVQMIDTVIVGGGQAGLAMSRCLMDRNISHVILERGRVIERSQPKRAMGLFAIADSELDVKTAWKLPVSRR